METKDELSFPIIRSRRNSIQPLDRHINEIDLTESISINAGIDSTCGIRRNSKVEILPNKTVDSSHLTSNERQI